MLPKSTRREFMVQTGAAAAGLALSEALGPALAWAEETPAAARARVVVARDEALAGGEVAEHAELLIKMLDASVQKLTQAPDAAAAWRKLFGPKDRVGIKVNTLGRYTQPAVVDAIVAGLRKADVPAENIIIWDRFDNELLKAGYKLNKSASGVSCYGTDSDKGAFGSGYQEKVETSGEVATCFSRILAEKIDALICAPVFKDHGIAGVSLSMKNFYGVFNNPNKYHGNNCDPFIADIVSHPIIRNKLRLTVCDGTRGQVQGGPGIRHEHTWPWGGLLVGTDFVALDAVGAHLLEQERAARKMKALADEGRPPKHIATAAGRGLGIADLSKIERLEI